MVFYWIQSVISRIFTCALCTCKKTTLVVSLLNWPLVDQKRPFDRFWRSPCRGAGVVRVKRTGVASQWCGSGCFCFIRYILPEKLFPEPFSAGQLLSFFFVLHLLKKDHSLVWLLQACSSCAPLLVERYRERRHGQHPTGSCSSYPFWPNSRE